MQNFSLKVQNTSVSNKLSRLSLKFIIFEIIVVHNSFHPSYTNSDQKDGRRRIRAKEEKFWFKEITTLIKPVKIVKVKNQIHTWVKTQVQELYRLQVNLDMFTPVSILSILKIKRIIYPFRIFIKLQANSIPSNSLQ